MKNYIKTYESYITEKAIPLEDIVNSNNDIGLSIYNKTSNNIKHSYFTLYDFTNSKVLAFLYMRSLNRQGTIYEIENTAAEKNYGPDIYDLALMYIFPKGIKPDIIIKPQALNVWKYYYEKRSDIHKIKLKENDPDYVNRYEVDIHSGYNNDPEALKIINTVYYKDPNTNLNKLLEKGKEYLQKYNLNEKQLKDIGQKYFDEVYSSILAESNLFIPRNLNSRYDDIKRPFIDRGYKSEEIYVGDIDIESKTQLLNNKYKVVIGSFDCGSLDIDSLKGCPKIVTRTFNCSFNNKLLNLEYGPIEVLGTYACANNQLTSLKGAPKKIGGSFSCYNNNLISLEGCPKEVNGDFYCNNNTDYFTPDEVREVCNVKGKINTR